MQAVGYLKSRRHSASSCHFANFGSWLQRRQRYLCVGGSLSGSQRGLFAVSLQFRGQSTSHHDSRNDAQSGRSFKRPCQLHSFFAQPSARSHRVRAVVPRLSSRRATAGGGASAHDVRGALRTQLGAHAWALASECLSRATCGGATGEGAAGADVWGKALQFHERCFRVFRLRAPHSAA